MLGVSPKDAIAVENAPLGIRSCKKAGLYCVAVTSTLSAKYLKEADEIVSSHVDLGKRLMSLAMKGQVK
jgi:beta-phosphoglucomutase